MPLWENDLWADIYEVKEPETQRVIIRLYRLVLDIHNKDILSEQIAAALRGERRIYLTLGQKIGGFVLGLLLAADALTHLFH